MNQPSENKSPVATITTLINEVRALQGQQSQLSLPAQRSVAQMQESLVSLVDNSSTVQNALSSHEREALNIFEAGIHQRVVFDSASSLIRSYIYSFGHLLVDSLEAAKHADEVTILEPSVASFIETTQSYSLVDPLVPESLGVDLMEAAMHKKSTLLSPEPSKDGYYQHFMKVFRRNIATIRE